MSVEIKHIAFFLLICQLTPLFFFFYFQVDAYDIKVAENLGNLELLKLEKKKYWMHDDWYCKYITVKTPVGDYIDFPCFRWLVDDKEVILRDGRGGILFVVSFTRTAC